jgi:hypothetical protein
MQHLDLGVQFMKPCLGEDGKCGHLLHALKRIQHLMELKNVPPLGFYALRRNCQESPKWFRMRLETGHKTNVDTWIEEPSSLLDSYMMHEHHVKHIEAGTFNMCDFFHHFHSAPKFTFWGMLEPVSNFTL